MNLTLKPDLRGKVAVVTGGAGGDSVGLPTDSRAFTSFARHEYFRRILCNKLGTLVEEGQYPCDIATLGEMVRDICHRNAVNYFGF